MMTTISHETRSRFFQIYDNKFVLFSRLKFKYHSSLSEVTALSKNMYVLHLRIMTLSSSQMKILPNEFSFVLLLCNTLRYAEVSKVTSKFLLDEVYVAVRHVTLSWVRFGLVRLRHVKSGQVYATSSQVRYTFALLH